MTEAAPATASRDGELESYLRLLTGHQPAGRVIEIRYTTGPGQMAHRFINAADRSRTRRLISALARRTDVYVGVLLRDRRSGGREAVSSSHLVFIETDDVQASEELDRFAHQPTMLVASGTPGHLHAYWQLHQPIGAGELEQANRRLAHRLGGDLASVDAARILRPPASWNHKHDPPAPVRLLRLARACRYTLDELVGELADPPAARAAHGKTAGPRDLRHPLDRILLAIPAERYVHALTGKEPNRAGKVSCPFHDDSNPSLQLYADGSWYCFACRFGGTVYDFAARLWGWETKDRAFLVLRNRVARELGERR